MVNSTVNEDTFKATSPGDVLKKMLKAKDLSQTDFAKNVGISKSHVSDIIHGRISISKQIAEKIGNLLGPNPEFWQNLQMRYNYDLQRIDPSAAESLKTNDSLSSLDNVFDINTIIKRLNLSKMNPKVILEELRTVFKNISSTDNVETELAGLFRKSQKTGLDERMAKTWIVIAKYVNNNVVVTGKFDRNCKESVCQQLCQVFHENKNVLERVSNILSSFGIKFSVVEKVDRASVDGFSFMKNDTPSIVITKRFNRIDNLAFNVMHEIGHIFLHLSDNETSGLNIPGDVGFDKKEEEANSFARNALIPDRIWKNAPSVPMNVFIIQKTYTKWAQDNNFNKWIVLGRISQETGMYKFKDDNMRIIG
jgi:HTH-type transcriptional regulator/antitoxin HigA